MPMMLQQPAGKITTFEFGGRREGGKKGRREEGKEGGGKKGRRDENVDIPWKPAEVDGHIRCHDTQDDVVHDADTWSPSLLT
jgi:hypothetical protein